MCLIASVCFWAVENFWAKSSTAPPKRPAWDMGASSRRVRSGSRISARFSQRCLSWTTAVDITKPRERAVTFVARRARSVAARSSSKSAGSVLPSCMSRSILAW
ncbi:hypothetical protein PO909_004262 [Leuciscus waleckii]